jgi:hypothetical protein
MRTVRVLTLGLMLALAPAGCGRGGGDDGLGVATAQSGPATSAAPSATATPDKDAPLKFAQCMRKNGMTWFPDPEPGGRMTIRTPKGMDPKKFEAAQEACKEFAPNGGEPMKADPQMLEKARQMARCMRENGVPGFPDPDADGPLKLDPGKLGTGPGDPTFDKAEQKCSQFMPDGASTERHEGAEA